VSEGRWVLLIVGAPEAVNRAWYQRFPGALPGGLPLWSRCEATV
jgi:hypothetical protein